MTRVNQKQRVTPWFYHSAEIFIVTCLSTRHVMGWADNLINKQIKPSVCIQGSKRKMRKETSEHWVVSLEETSQVVTSCWSNREFLSLGHRAEGWQQIPVAAFVSHLWWGECGHSRAPECCLVTRWRGIFLNVKMINEEKERLATAMRHRTIKWISGGREGGRRHNKWVWEFHAEFQWQLSLPIFRLRAFGARGEDESNCFWTQRSCLTFERTEQSHLWLWEGDIYGDVAALRDLHWGIQSEEDPSQVLIFIRFVISSPLEWLHFRKSDFSFRSSHSSVLNTCFIVVHTQPWTACSSLQIINMSL